MTKKINTDAILNELKEGSLFFSRPPASKASQPQESSTPEAPAKAVSYIPSPNARTVERPSERSSERSVESPVKETPRRRQARRYSFEIYEDQIERIKRIALENQLSGGELTQSAIARTALDHYLDSLEKKQ